MISHSGVRISATVTTITARMAAGISHTDSS